MALTKKDKNQLVVLLILIFIFIIASMNSYAQVQKSLAKRKKILASVPSPITYAQTSSGEQAVAPGVQFPGGSVASGGIDPFTGKPIAFEGEGGQSSLKISGIVYSTKNPTDSYAIINNFIVKVGDTIPGSQLKVAGISEEEITVSDGTNKMQLKNW